MRSEIEQSGVTFPMTPAAKQHALGRFALGGLQRTGSAYLLFFLSRNKVVELQRLGAPVVTAYHALRPIFRFQLGANPAAPVSVSVNLFLFGRMVAMVIDGRSRARKSLCDRSVA